MRSIPRPSFLSILAVLALGLPGVGVAQEGTPLEGAWLVTSWVVNGETIEAQPGLFLFTRTHYSTMFVPGAEPRAQYAGESMTDEDMLAAYPTIVANSGRYEVNGDEFTTRAYVAKNPNYMGSFPENASTFGFRIEGDTLTLLVDGEEVATLRRVEGLPFEG